VLSGRRVDAAIVEIEDHLPETEAQWMEHSEAWRLAHLDRAPSAYLRQQVIARLESADLAASEKAKSSLPRFAAEMLMILAVVTLVVIGAAVR
jgi:hypothetical protein